MLDVLDVDHETRGLYLAANTCRVFGPGHVEHDDAPGINEQTASRRRSLARVSRACGWPPCEPPCRVLARLADGARTCATRPA